jgi:hypothetical protein
VRDQEKRGGNGDGVFEQGYIQVACPYSLHQASASLVASEGACEGTNDSQGETDPYPIAERSGDTRTPETA